MPRIATLCLFLLFPHVSGAEDKTFEDFDRSGDGIITYLEFAVTLRERFTAWDRNENGHIEPDEFQPVSQGVFNLPEFQTIDLDRNARLSLHEFGTAVQIAFDRIDTIVTGRRDRRITLAEHTAAREKARAEINAAEAAEALRNPG